MKKILNYKGIEYYLLKELLKQHPSYLHISERQEVAPLIFSFYGERYITAATWHEIETLIKIDTEYYTQFDVVMKLNYKGKDTDKGLFELLKTIVEPFVHNDVEYYKKTGIDRIGTLGELYSIYSGVNVITSMELVQYHNQNRMYHKGNLYISAYHLQFLYSKSELTKINNKLCVRIDKRKDVYKDFEKRCATSNEITYFDNYFGTVERFKESYELIREFYILRINKSKSMQREQGATYLIGMLYYLYSVLTKEIFQYTEQELNDDIITDPRLGANRDIIHFINYVKEKHSTFLPDVVSYYVKANNKIANYEQIIYSPSEFAAIYNEAISTSRHVENAYNDHAYAQYWLYLLFQLSDFIRASDILNMPILELPQEYEWGYFCENEISYIEAQSICNICEIEARNILIGKTMGHKRLYFLQGQTQALAIALVICIGHAKKRRLALLFSMKTISAERIYNKLGEPFLDVSNRKMNYTLATYLEATGNEADEYRAQVYTLLTYMRGHKTQTPLNVSNTTLVYIKTANKDQNIANMSYHATQRGAFGWLYHILLDYAGEKFDSLEAETERIKELSNKYLPKQLEDISEFVLNEKREREEVLRILAKIKKADIKTFLSRMGTVGTFKTNQNLPCVFGVACPKKGANCAYCEFSIKTIHSLYVYRDELDKILNNLDNSTDFAVIQKNMYLMYKILVVLKELRMEFGKDYVELFVNMEEIKERTARFPESHIKALEELDK